MPSYFIYLYLILAILIAPMGRKRVIGIVGAFFAAIFLTPIIGVFIVLNSPSTNPKGCFHCGNRANEAEFCGLCGKNKEGFTREDLLKQENV